MQWVVNAYTVIRSKHVPLDSLTLSPNLRSCSVANLLKCRSDTCTNQATRSKPSPPVRKQRYTSCLACSGCHVTSVCLFAAALVAWHAKTAVVRARRDAVRLCKTVAPADTGPATAASKATTTSRWHPPRRGRDMDGGGQARPEDSLSHSP